MRRKQKQPTHYRQGDVLITRVNDAIPSDAKRKPRDKGRVVLAYGEVTGHAHALDAPGAELFVVNDLTLLSLQDKAELRHEEHGSVHLPAGNYQVVIQREYTPQGLRNVAD